MNISSADIIDFKDYAGLSVDNYKNFALSEVNDHVIRLSIMKADFYWHYHPNSDETFIVIDGTLLIDFETGTIELNKGQMITVPKNLPHRTRPKDGQSINLTIELTAMETVRIDRE